MSDVTFKKGKDGYVAEFNAPGNILMQIYGEKQGRLTVYQYIDGMPPAQIDTINFTNNILPLNLLPGLKVRLESDVEVKKCKYLQKSGMGESEPYVLPEASDSVLGGIKLGFSQSGKKYPVKLEGGKAYVEVQWTDNNTTYEKATDSNLGLVKIGYSENSKKYALKLDGDGKAYIEVPWENTTYSAADKSTLGLVKQLALIQDATGQADAHEKLNALFAEMKKQGTMASS